jgi:hypothetical protein
VVGDCWSEGTEEREYRKTLRTKGIISFEIKAGRGMSPR